MSITPDIKTKADTQQSSAETTSLRSEGMRLFVPPRFHQLGQDIFPAGIGLCNHASTLHFFNHQHVS